MDEVDELFTRRLKHKVKECHKELDEAIERQLNEHPLDTLLRTMLEHKWPEDDPMVRWARLAMKIPYPMSRYEAIERGLLGEKDLI